MGIATKTTIAFGVSSVELLLQDVDVSGPENLDVQVLTTHNWIGKKKARMAAKFAEGLAFKTAISERRFTATTARSASEPGLLLCGVDNIETRRAAARSDANFSLVIDAGLGGSSSEIFDIRIHGFPGAKSPTEAWPAMEAEARAMPQSLRALVDDGRLDQCGAMTIANTNVGVPSTAVVAAAVEFYTNKAFWDGISFDDYFAERIALKARLFNSALNDPELLEKLDEEEIQRRAVAYRKASRGG